MLKVMRLALTTGLLLAAGSALATERTLILDVENVGCVTCIPVVKAAIGGVAGVSSVTVVEEGAGRAVATVTYDDEMAAPEALALASTNAGYPALVRTDPTP